MSHTLVLPIGNQSSYFPNMKPKWMLTHPNGYWMLLESLTGLPLDQFDEIVIIGLTSYIDQNYVSEGIREQFKLKGWHKPVKIIAISASDNQPQTIYNGLKQANITGAIFIKDCDNCFHIANIPKDNCVTYIDLNKHDSIYASEKSYIQQDDQGIINNIVEKYVISNTFCCGGYGFDSVDTFYQLYEAVSSISQIDSKQLYLSHLISYGLLNKTFIGIQADNFVDWGCLKLWREYVSQYKTLFVDVDGILLENTGRFSEPTWGTGNGIQPNIDLINTLYKNGKHQIILTTARVDIDQLVSELNLHGVCYHRIVNNLWHCQRIIINDFADTNPYPSCDSISIPRNSNLGDYL